MSCRQAINATRRKHVMTSCLELQAESICPHRGIFPPLRWRWRRLIGTDDVFRSMRTLMSVALLEKYLSKTAVRNDPGYFNDPQNWRQ